MKKKHTKKKKQQRRTIVLSPEVQPKLHAVAQLAGSDVITVANVLLAWAMLQEGAWQTYPR